MTTHFAVLTWNLHRASAKSGAWNYLRELDPDIALLQEVNSLPAVATDRYACRWVPAIGQTAL